MTESRGTQIELPLAEQVQIRRASERLRHESGGVLNALTIERFMTDPLDQLLERATVSKWLPLRPRLRRALQPRGDVRIRSMNPARSLAPALAGGPTDALWVDFAAPLAGAAISTLAYAYLATPARGGSTT